MFLRLLLITSFLLSCGTIFRSQPSTGNKSELEQLSNKSTIYQELISIKKQDSNGFIMTDKCDSLLFSGLLSAAAPDSHINILAARDNLGGWHRRPGQDCGPEFNNSKSTISRDMVIGLMWHLYKNNNKDVAIELMEQLKSNLYSLQGEGTPGELFMLPAYMNTLAKLIQKLGGPDYTVELLLPAVFSKHTGFKAHLTVWHILLRGEIDGSLDEDDMDILEHHVNRQPNNPLFQAAYHKYLDGNQADAIRLLLNKAEWPATSLPSTAEHCSDWVIERDFTQGDWGPCEPRHEHTGAELVILYNLLIKP